ncbi:DMT family transporter [Robiginitomaculum antarcticum]|uniref:DMT family transporter n=1 Tax=Robiginitomaculum antarcticum TaxID=437507 RepID=UPI000374A6C0|nr:DMT family transporter [Robiginitomaculum antarcticum]
MAARDFLIFIMCNLLWAGNLAVSAWALGRHGVPPFMLAALRAVIVFVIMTPFLFRPRPEHFSKLMLVCFCVGPLHLGLLYTGLQTASATGAGIVSQMLVPFAAVLSVIFLRERPSVITFTAIIGAFFGSCLMIYEPGGLSADTGLLYIGGAYFALAIGSVLIRTVGRVDWRIYVVWVAVIILPVMIAASLFFETGHTQIINQATWPLMIAGLYAALGVSIVAHGQYFALLQHYTVNRIVPLTIITPLFTALLGLTFLGENLSPKLVLGALFILPCVYIIATRQPEIAAGETADGYVRE